MRRAMIVGSMLVLLAASGCRGRQSTRALDPSNELPLGHVDTPTDGAHVGSELNVGGWALDDRGIREVRVYIDGHFVNAGPLNTNRPDVSKMFPSYAHENHLHGWTIPVEFPTAGPHKMLVQAVDSDGATRDIGVLDVISGG
jgi:hypothetical protein